MTEPVTLTELKLWARVEHNADDTLLTALGIAAREFVETATGRTYVGDDAEIVPERAKAAIKALAAHWYEFRTPTEGERDKAVLPFHVRTLLYQLKNWCPAPAETENEDDDA